MLKRIQLMIIVIFLGLMGADRALSATENYLIPDDNLRAAVETALGVTNPTQDDMVNLWSLDAPDSGIVDLTGLDYAVNLVYLNLSGNQISSISQLSGLTNLMDLFLNDNNISDISALSELLNLQYLYLYNNQISDISGLSGLTNLQDLMLFNNLISDISGFWGLDNITTLNLGNNMISDISGLSEFTTIQSLFLDYNLLSDISGLSGLTNLWEISLDNNLISDISVLSEFPALQEVYLVNNQISDISALSALTDLQILDMSFNPLNRDAYCIYLPSIEANNPGLLVYSDINLNECTVCTDSDNDGYFAQDNCGTAIDCVDNNPDLNPGVAEVCDNMDNNCDGQKDENLIRPTTCGIGICAGNTGTETCASGVWGNDTCDPLAGSSAEVCDSIDNDCDGTIDEAPDTDGDGVNDCYDNCRLVKNSDQIDDNSGEDDNASLTGIQHYGDACDPDFDDDGLVTLTDYAEWRKYYRQSASSLSATVDLDNDGLIGLSDYAIWRKYYRSVPGPGTE